MPAAISSRDARFTPPGYPGWEAIAVAAILVPYFVLALVASFQQGRRYGFGLALPLPFLFFAYHFSYGLGTLCGAVRLLVGAAPVQRKGRGKGKGVGSGN